MDAGRMPDALSKLAHPSPSTDPADARAHFQQYEDASRVYEETSPSLRFWPIAEKESGLSLSANHKVTRLPKFGDIATTAKTTSEKCFPVLGKRKSDSLSEKSQVHSEKPQEPPHKKGRPSY